MKCRSKVVLIILVTDLFVGCATAPRPVQDQTTEQNAQLAVLGSRLMGAMSDGVNYLSPENFKKAQDQYSFALKESMARRADAADQAAAKGLVLLDQAVADAGVSREIFRDVLIARERVTASGANTLFPEEYQNLESRFRTATNLVEQGKLEDAKRNGRELLKALSDFEQVARSKKGVIEAQAALASAESVDADEYAPRTFKLAQDELQTAQASLDGGQQNFGNAGLHAANAVSLAQRAIKLTDLAKDFEENDFEYEDVLLWHQQQLEEIGTSLGSKLAFDKGNREVILDIRSSISSLIKDNADLALQLDQARHDLKVADERQQQLKRKHQEEMIGLQESLERERDSKKIQTNSTKPLPIGLRERFAFVQSLFYPQEARVFMRQKNIIISAQGFHFPPGKSEIDDSNIPLLKKIIEAIKEFPGSNVSVEGHTDWMGSAKMNLKLSEERARKVANYLIYVGKIDAARIFSQGLGEGHPIASNKTEEGRAANRRVEIQILNN